MSASAVDNLQELWESRSVFFGDDHRVMDEMVGIYNGSLPPDFDDYFHEDMHIHVPNMIRLSWDDLTAMAGKEFPLYVRPDSDSATAKKRAEHLEMIGYGYNNAGRIVGGISMKTLMQVLNWWMIGCANAVALALPNYEHQTPFFTFRDPRTFLPPIGWTPYTQAAPEDALFVYQITIGELKSRYEDAAREISEKLQKGKYSFGDSFYGRASKDDSDPVWVGEYYHEDSWVLATLTDDSVTLVRSDTGDRGHPDVMPVVPMGFYSATGPKGRSLFADQASIQAALARMFSQKLDYYDRTLYQLIFHTPVSGNSIKMGPYATNEYVVTSGIQPRVDAIGPAHPIDADQTMAFVLGLSRMLNRNPEQFQGAGEADSAKALAELKSGITSTVRDTIWPPQIEALPKLYRVAAKIDMNVWPYRRRYVVGTRKNSDFRVPYTPAVHLNGRENSFEVEPGLGLAGYQGTVEILQLLGAEAIPEDDALEQLPYTKEPQAAKRKIFNDRLQKVMFADLAGKGQQGVLVPGSLAEIRRRVNDGEDPYDVIENLEKEGRLYVMPQMAPPGGPPVGPPGAGPGPMAPELGALRQMASAGRR